jgi:hypothetical protein
MGRGIDGFQGTNFKKLRAVFIKDKGTVTNKVDCDETVLWDNFVA